jgi:hypothetical protein
MFTNNVAGLVLFACCAAVANASTLTLDDIDQLSRAKVVQDLTSGASASSGTAPAHLAPSQPAAPAAAPVVHVADKALSRGNPVTFVGAYRDERGSHVLYAFNNAVYDALTGNKLLNGWTAEKVNGFAVTVKYGRESWTETIRSASPAAAPVMSPSIQAINDLGSPLPPPGAMAANMGTPRFGR